MVRQTLAQELQHFGNSVERGLSVPLWLPTQVFLSSRGGIPDGAVPRGNDFGPAGPVPGMRVFQVFVGIREVSMFQAGPYSFRGRS